MAEKNDIKISELLTGWEKIVPKLPKSGKELPSVKLLPITEAWAAVYFLDGVMALRSVVSIAKKNNHLEQNCAVFFTNKFE